MAKERERWRSKSDAVFRIAKTAGTGIYKRLKAFNDVFSKKSKQFKYYDYCYHLDEWSAEKEKEDWEGTNIASLKHATLRWLVKSLTVITDWQEKDLGSLYLEITRASSLQGDDWALALTMEAIELGMKEEEYEVVLKILRHQRLLIDRYLAPESRGEALEESFQLHDLALGRMAEIAQWERWHFQHYHRVGLQNEQKGRVKSGDLQKLDEFLNGKPFGEIKTATSKYIYLTMSIPRHVLKKDLGLALDDARALITMYGETPWLRKRYLHQYVSHLKAITLLAETMGDSSYANEVLDRLTDLGNGAESERVLAIPNLIQAKVWICELRKDKSTAKEAVGLVLEHWDAIEAVLKPKNFSWLLFRGAKSAIGGSEYLVASKMLEEVISRAPKTNADLRIHARLMNLLVRVVNGFDREWLEHYCHSTSIFLSRSPNSNSTQILILNAVKQALKAANLTTPLDLFEPLCTILEADEEHKERASQNGYFDYLSWFKQFSEVIHDLHQD